MNIKHILPPVGFVPKDPVNSAYGGITMTAMELAKRQRIENEVSIVGLSREERPFRFEYENVLLRGIKTYNWAIFGKYNFSYLAPIMKFLMLNGKTDILHCYTDPSLLYLPGKFRVIHLQNILRADNPLSLSRALSRADAIICCSQYVRKEIIKILPTVSNKSYVVHNGGKSFSEQKSSLKQKLGIDKDSHLILFSGAVVPEKGLHVLINAFSQIINEVDNVYLLIAGSSLLWYNSKAKNSISNYELDLIASTRNLPIIFLGKVNQNDIGNIYKAASIFCCPSIWDEPFGIVNVEAMSAGLPIVASSVGGIPEVVNNEVGRLVPPNDADALSQAIIELLNNDKLRTLLSKNAIERAKLFTWDRSYLLISDIYDQVIKDNQQD